MQSINSKHFMFLIFGTSIVSLKTYPNIIVMLSGRDAWISVAVASVFFILYFIYLIEICLKTNTFNLIKIYKGALGKSSGIILIVFYIMTLFIALIECSTVQGSSVKNHLLINTPVWYILIFFFATTLYSLRKNLNALIITCIVGLSFIFIAGINLGFLTVKYKDFKYIYPIMANGIDKNFIFSVIKSLALYSTIFITFPFLDYVQDKYLLKKNTLIAMLIVAQMEIVAMHGLITTFGPKRSLDILYPKIIQTQLVSMFHFLESGEFFVLLQIVGGWFIKYIVTGFSIMILIKNFNYHNKNAIYMVTGILFIITYYISNNNIMLFRFIEILPWIYLINFFVVPCIVFTIYSIKHKFYRIK